ncbi:hypothetical protein EV363DRAFT_1296457 [Boletus edulis]|nr:hypothetical protein EV363DRAFT_1296457 [Boletus edulis]
MSDCIFTSSDDALEVIRLLSKAAIEMNISPVIAELGQVEAMGTGRLDPLNDVPEVMPVKKLVDVSQEIVDEDGNVVPEDVAACQKLLEASVYDVAVEAQARGQSLHLQRWMWDWHQKLRSRLETKIADIIAPEAKQTRTC